MTLDRNNFVWLWAVGALDSGGDEDEPEPRRWAVRVLQTVAILVVLVVLGIALLAGLAFLLAHVRFL